jgi:hypothetical protein
MMKSIWAIVAGFLFIAALSIGSDAIMHAIAPRLYGLHGETSNVVILCLMTMYVGVFATVGSYLTARLAPSRPMRHALILGALGLTFSLMTTAKMWNMAPAWYNIINLLLVMPYAWLGGRLRENEIGSSSTPIAVSHPAIA